MHERIFRTNSHKIKLAVTAFRNGKGKAIFLVSLTHGWLTMDYVTTTEKLESLGTTTEKI